jgi:hypothetical protein
MKNYTIFKMDVKPNYTFVSKYSRFFHKMVFEVSTIDIFYKHGYSLESIKVLLFEVYGIYIPDSESGHYWFIPNEHSELIEWFRKNCDFPYKELKRSNYSTVLKYKLKK